MPLRAPSKEDIKIIIVPITSRAIVVLNTIFTTGDSFSPLKYLGKVIAITGAIPPKIIKNDTVNIIIGSLLYGIKLSEINAYPALQKPDTARNMPCLNPNNMSLL